MLKIMFVDDEVSVLNGLRNGYDWDELGFEVIASASNAEEALEKFYECSPDVVLTDICMGNRNGISLITELKAHFPHVEIIILSGYPEFQYAKAALELGVFAYLLKPLKNAELFKTLEQVKAKIEQQRSPSLSLFLSELLQLTSSDISSIQNICQKYKVTLPNKPYTLIAIQFQADLKLQASDELPLICREFFLHLNRYYQAFTGQPKPHHIAVLIFHEQMMPPHTLYMQLDSLKKKASMQYQKELAIGVSNCFSDISSIRDAYLQALYAVSQKAFFGNDCTITYNEASPLLTENSLSSSCFLEEQQQEELFHNMKLGNKECVFHILDGYFQKLSNLHNINIDLIRNALIDMTFQLVHSAAADTAQMQLVFGQTIYPASAIQKLTTLSEIREYIYHIVNQILTYRQTHSTQHYSKLVTDTIVFIMNNYALPISIDTIAQELYVDRYQLMKTFKAETGDTINHYLIDYRLQLAKDFLKEKKLSIQEIGGRVGYQDTGYFSRIFKKQVGCSPSEYQLHED